MKKHLLFLFAALLPLLASAQTKVEIDGIWYNLITEGNVAEVTFKGGSHDEYNEYSGHITIPATVTHEGAEYAVTSIGDMALTYCSNVTSITIPESVTNIGQYAFFSCSGLTAVYISDIADWCNIWFSNSDANPLSIAKNLYLNGELVTELTIPEGVTSIEDYVFYGYSNLTTVTLPDGMTNIRERAFQYCNGLTTINIPESVRLIDEYAFSLCI